MPNAIATRIEAVAVSVQGTALALVVIKQHVEAQLAATPRPSDEDIVKTVGQMNDANEKDYGENVWTTYVRLYLAPAPAAVPRPSARHKDPLT